MKDFRNTSEYLTQKAKGLQLSQIFNPHRIANASTIFFDKTNVATFLSEKKKYLPSVENEIADIEKTFEQTKLDARNQGLECPSEMPAEMFEKYCVLHGRKTVIFEEITELEKRLKEFTDKVEEEDLSRLLEYGLKQSSSLRGGILVEIDGQKVIQQNGMLIIANGPYKGMNVLNYRQISNQWLKDRREADKKKLLRLQEEARQLGKPVPNFLAGGSRKADPKSLPPYPSDYKHYDINKA